MDDTIDILKGISQENDKLEISRLKLLKVGSFDENSDKFTILLRKYPKLFINDYKNEEDEWRMY